MANDKQLEAMAEYSGQARDLCAEAAKIFGSLSVVFDRISQGDHLGNKPEDTMIAVISILDLARRDVQKLLKEVVRCHFEAFSRPSEVSPATGRRLSRIAGDIAEMIAEGPEACKAAGDD